MFKAKPTRRSSACTSTRGSAASQPRFDAGLVANGIERRAQAEVRKHVNVGRRPTPEQRRTARLTAWWLRSPRGAPPRGPAGCPCGPCPSAGRASSRAPAPSERTRDSCSSRPIRAVRERVGSARSVPLAADRPSRIGGPSAPRSSDLGLVAIARPRPWRSPSFTARAGPRGTRRWWLWWVCIVSWPSRRGRRERDGAVWVTSVEAMRG